MSEALTGNTEKQTFSVLPVNADLLYFVPRLWKVKAYSRIAYARRTEMVPSGLVPSKRDLMFTVKTQSLSGRRAACVIPLI